MTTALNPQDFSAELQHLLAAEQDEPTFLERLLEAMATSCGASAAWLQRVDGDNAEVLSDEEFDLEDYAALASRDERFAGHRRLATDEHRVVTLELSGPTTLAIDSSAFDSLLDTPGVIFFAPLASNTVDGLSACLYCEADMADDVPALRREIALMAKLSDLWMLQQAEPVAEPPAAPADDPVDTEQLALELDESRRTQERLRGALSLGDAASAGLEKEKTAYLLANHLRGHLDADRVSVLEVTGKQARLLAVSGQATFDRRSNAVRAAQRLAKVALKAGDPLWFDGGQDALAPPVQKVVAPYVDETLAQGFALLPLYERRAPHFRSDEQSLVEFVNPGRNDKRVLRGAVLVENLDRPLDRETVEPRWLEVESQASNQFSNAKRHSDLVMLPALRLLTRFASLYRGHTWRKAWGLTLGLAGLLAAGFLTPADFRVRCEGRIQPDTMHHVFVKKDGVVQTVLVKEGEEVAQGAALAELRNRDLEFEIAELQGELEEKRRTEEHLLYRRLDYANNAAAQRAGEGYHELAEEASLVAGQIRALEKTLKLKLRQQSDLVIRAPFAGRVMGWNVDRRYLNRPLDQGTRLFSVAQSGGASVLELKVPDQRSGYINLAWRGSEADGKPLPIEFSIASLPDRRFRGEVTHVNPGLEQDSDLGYVMPLEAHPVDELPEGLRSGVPVVAKVVCGRRSFIYCKSYEFVDWVQRTAFEYLL